MTLVADWNSSVSVPFQRMRQQLLDGVLQEGIVGASDLKVVQRGAGANQSVDVGAGFAWVQIDTGTRNGMGHVTNDAVANVVVTASNGTNPRIDQIILRWNDTSIPTGSGNIPTLAVLTGTATVGATLDNRTGAAALPNDCLRLADILVPTSSTSVVTANIRDRRPWARGAFRRLTRTAGNISVSTGVLTLLDSTNLNPRIECSGAVLRIAVRCRWQHSAVAGSIQFVPFIDGVQVTGAWVFGSTPGAAANATPYGFYCEFEWVPAAGSHLLGIAANAAATGTVLSSGAEVFEMTVSEIIRQNADNT